MKKLADKNLKNMIRILGIALILFIVLRGIFVLSVLIVLSLSMTYVVNVIAKRQLGLELVTFVSVVAGITYGPIPALILSFILITYHMVAGGFIGNYIMWVIPAHAIAGGLAGVFAGSDPIQLGIILTFAINANNIFFTIVTSPAYLTKYLPFAISNVLLNIFLFSLLLRPVLFLIG